MRFIQLALPLRLDAGDVEKWTDRVCVRRLIAFVIKNAQKNAVVCRSVEIHAAGILRFGREVVIRRLKERRARDPGSQAP